MSPLSIAPAPRRTPRPVATLMKTASDLTHIRVCVRVCWCPGGRTGEKGVLPKDTPPLLHLYLQKQGTKASSSRIGQYF